MPRPALRDALLALVLCGFSLLQVVIDEGIPEPRWLTAVSVVLVTVPVAFRLVATVPAVAVFAVGHGLPTLYSDTSLQGPGVLLAALVMSFTIGSSLSARRAVIAGAIFTAGVVVHELRVALDGDPAAAFFWLLAATVFLAGRYARRHRHAQRLEGEIERAVADERARIARELHDIVSHNVSVMVVQAEAAGEILSKDPQRAAAPLETIQSSGREALGEMRRMLGVLRDDGRSADLAPRAGLAQLSELAARVRASGLDVELRIEGDPRVPPGLDLAAFRVVQEALTNVIRHAHATRAEVVVRCVDDRLEVEVSDDGHGMNGSSDPGHGLAGMRERVRLFNGRLEAGDHPGGGFRILATFPAA